MRSSTIDTRSPRRRAPHQGGSVLSTKGPSPTVAQFRSLAERYARCPYRERDDLRARLVAFIRSTRYPGRCVNELLDECLSRGGADGMELAIEVLSQTPVPTLEAAREFRIGNRAKWVEARQRNDRRTSLPHDVWHVLLRAACQSADFFDGLELLLASVYLGPDNFRESVASAVTDMASRRIGDDGALKFVLRRALHPKVERGDPPLSEFSRRALEDAMAELEG